MNFIELKRNLKRDAGGLKKVSAALLGDSATQFLGQALRGYAYTRGLNLRLFEGEYNQIAREIALETSDLYQHPHDYIIIHQTTQKLRKRFYSLDPDQRRTFAEGEAQTILAYVERIGAKLRHTKIIVTNFVDINDGVFGHYANSVETSFSYQIRRLNYELMRLAVAYSHLLICDVAHLSAAFGQTAAFDARNYIDADIAFSLDFLPVLAKGVIDVVSATSGGAKKCLILDLDNTVWGGIIGDDGLEKIEIGDLGIGKAFVELQYWARELQRRGILLAVCSKNNEDTAKSPFEQHPDMVLTLDDIAFFVANWDSKADNVRRIKEFFNIGYDSMVFLDDNPYERGVVRHHHPEVLVPDLPEDPSDYMTYLYGLNLFETANYTAFDKDRTVHFQQEAKREHAQTLYSNENDFLADLGMACVISPLNAFNLPRVAQLLQRSNQFNLRTIRHTEEELKVLAADPDSRPLVIQCKDRFGDYGIISVIIARHSGHELFIDSWVMSCRVLKRGIEDLALNMLADIAKAAGATHIRGEYIPTAKNALVADHYSTLGFSPSGPHQWVLNVNEFIARHHFISLQSAA